MSSYNVGDIVIVGNKSSMITEAKLDRFGKVEYWTSDSDYYKEDQLDFYECEDDPKLLVPVKGKVNSLKSVA